MTVVNKHVLKLTEIAARKGVIENKKYYHVGPPGRSKKCLCSNYTPYPAMRLRNHFFINVLYCSGLEENVGWYRVPNWASRWHGSVWKTQNKKHDISFLRFQVWTDSHHQKSTHFFTTRIALAKSQLGQLAKFLTRIRNEVSHWQKQYASKGVIFCLSQTGEIWPVIATITSRPHTETTQLRSPASKLKRQCG